jgi:glycosyltransferase involved in cell wall biosynthesis
MITSCFQPNIGGLETHLEGVCEYLAEKGHYVTVITYQPQTTKLRGIGHEKGNNTEIFRLSWFGHNWRHRLERSPILLFLYEFPALFIKSFSYLLRHRKEVDVIDAQGLVTSVVAKLLAALFNKRTVTSVHAIFGFSQRPVLSKAVRWALSSSDVILPFAKKTEDELVSIGLPKQSMMPYVSWVDLDIFRPMPKEECRKELGLNGKFIALFVGRLIEKKGVNVLLETAARCNPEITFAFVGDGPMAERILEEAKVRPNVVYLGKMPNRETPRCYNAADVLVMPSQYEEQFGVVVLEALACGTPLIAANRGGIPEVMDASVGVLVEPTADDFTSKVCHYYDHREELAILADNCRSFAEARYSRDNMTIIERAYDGTK